MGSIKIVGIETLICGKALLNLKLSKDNRTLKLVMPTFNEKTKINKINNFSSS